MRLPDLRRIWRNVGLRMQPTNLTRTQRQNFLYTQADALGVGLVMAMHPFLPVFMARLGATNQQVGLLTAIPGFSGLALGLLMARFLETRTSIVPWYTGVRFVRLIGYGLIGVASLLIRSEQVIPLLLVLWFLLSIPAALLSVTYSVLMNAIAGPKGRFALLSRRWSTIGVTGAVMTVVAGQILDRLPFPLNYQLAFVGFAAVGASISFSASRRIKITDAPARPPRPLEAPLAERLKAYVGRILGERRFVAIVVKRSVYIFGSNLVTPLFALYYVRVLEATDAQISVIATVQKAILLVGYFVWTRLRDVRGSRFVLLSTTLAMSLYPALTAGTRRVAWMVVLVGVGAVFQAGLNLVFFDELMKTVPTEHAPTFVAVSKSLEHLLAIVGPILSTSLTGFIGLSGALLLGAAVRFCGFGLFLFGGKGKGQAA